MTGVGATLSVGPTAIGAAVGIIVAPEAIAAFFIRGALFGELQTTLSALEDTTAAIGKLAAITCEVVTGQTFTIGDDAGREVKEHKDQCFFLIGKSRRGAARGIGMAGRGVIAGGHVDVTKYYPTALFVARGGDRRVEAEILGSIILLQPDPPLGQRGVDRSDRSTALVDGKGADGRGAGLKHPVAKNLTLFKRVIDIAGDRIGGEAAAPVGDRLEVGGSAAEPDIMPVRKKDPAAHLGEILKGLTSGS